MPADSKRSTNSTSSPVGQRSEAADTASSRRRGIPCWRRGCGCGPALSSCTRPGSGGQPRAGKCRQAGMRTVPSTMSASRLGHLQQPLTTDDAVGVGGGEPVRAGSTPAHTDRAYSNPAARAAPTLPASTETKCTSRAELARPGARCRRRRSRGRRRSAPAPVGIECRRRQRAAGSAADGRSRCAREPPRRPAPAPSCLLISQLSRLSHLAPLR